MTTTLLSNHSELFAKHQANITASLARRLDRARATQNTQLLALLEQEQQQLGGIASSQPTSGVTPWFAVIWHRLTEAIAHPSRLSIEKLMSDGVIYWRAYDPTTNETRYAETEAEIIDWIEANHQSQYWAKCSLRYSFLPSFCYWL